MKYKNLGEIFIEYKDWSEINIVEYGDIKLTVENQKILIRIVDTYVYKKNLDSNKQKNG